MSGSGPRLGRKTLQDPETKVISLKESDERGFNKAINPNLARHSASKPVGKKKRRSVLSIPFKHGTDTKSPPKSPKKNVGRGRDKMNSGGRGVVNRRSIGLDIDMDGREKLDNVVIPSSRPLRKQDPTSESDDSFRGETKLPPVEPLMSPKEVFEWREREKMKIQAQAERKRIEKERIEREQARKEKAAKNLTKMSRKARKKYKEEEELITRIQTGPPLTPEEIDKHLLKVKKESDKKNKVGWGLRKKKTKVPALQPLTEDRELDY